MLRFALSLAGVALRHPREALDHLRTQLALSKSQASATATVVADERWRETLHALLAEESPCAAREEFRQLWSALLAELERDVAIGEGHDADPTLSEAVWCAVRHLRPQVVVETGVSRGITSRVILEALERNGAGRLWSIDLPPLEEPWRKLAGSAVPEGLRSRWTYLRGASRRRLPPLVRQLGTIDLFIHDSLHTEDNLRMELAYAWPALRPGGLVLVDDAVMCNAFARAVPELKPAASFAASHEAKHDVIAVLLKKAGPT